jgi:hypothetical protein
MATPVAMLTTKSRPTWGATATSATRNRECRRVVEDLSLNELESKDLINRVRQSGESPLPRIRNSKQHRAFRTWRRRSERKRMSRFNATTIRAFVLAVTAGALVSGLLCMAVPLASASAAVSPGYYFGESTQQLPVIFAVHRRPSVDFRFRWRGLCVAAPSFGGGPPEVSSRTYSSGPQGVDIFGKPFSFPGLPVNRSGRIATTRIYRIDQGDGSYSQEMASFVARFVTSKRLTGTARFIYLFYNGETRQVDSTCTSRLLHFAAYRLA